MKIKETLDIVILHEKLDKACEDLFYIAAKNAAPC
jgi:hypothetical protein